MSGHDALTEKARCHISNKQRFSFITLMIYDFTLISGNGTLNIFLKFK